MIQRYYSASTWIEGQALEQLEKTAHLPGVEEVAAMPDLHPGISYPVGVAVKSRGVIYPELIGGDIGCGMALFRTSINAGRFKAARFERKLLKCELSVETPEFPEEWPDWLRRDLGTLGQGNHFIELQEFHEIPDKVRGDALGLNRKNLWMLLHSGSRGHGQALLERTPSGALDPESEIGRKYLEQHNRLLQWAALNRRLIAEAFLEQLDASGEQCSDSCHNSILPIPEEPGCFLHRKGAAATDSGPFVIAGSRGSYSYFAEALGDQSRNLRSAAHGSGRKWTRRGARSRMTERFSAESLRRTKLGGLVICGDRDLLFEEAPEAYKNSETIVHDLVSAGIIRPLGVLKPVLTYKGPKTGNAY